MKRVALLLAGLFVSILVIAAACGCGDDNPTPTRRPPDTVAPTSAPAATATTAPVATSPPAATSAGGVTIDISATGDALSFSTDQLTASAGSEVVLTFSNEARAFEHNWVLVQSGTKDEVATAGLAAGPPWIPPDDDRIIVYTELLGPGATGEVRFTAPAAGTYQFVCTFPGHNAGGMFGVFEVTP